MAYGYMGVETVGDEQTFVSARQPAIVTLGTPIDKHITDYREIMRVAHLDNWNVRLEALPELTNIPADRWAIPRFITVRDNPFDGEKDVLGDVGQRYNVLQNEELYEFGQYLGSGAQWVSAGGAKKGRLVWGALAVEHETVLDPNGVSNLIKAYLLLTTSHDGSTAIGAHITPVNIWCANVLNFAMKNAVQSFKIRHTQSLEGKVAEARKTLGLAERYMTAFDKEAKAFFEKQITPTEFWDIVSAVHPEPDEDASKSAKTRHENKIEALTDLYTGPTVAPIADTAWGVLNLLTEDLDWNRGIRNDNPESKLLAAAGLDPIANNKRNEIVSIVKEKVGL